MRSTLYSSLHLLLLCVISLAGYGQGVGINSTGNAPDPSAILDASSTEKGLLIPRMNTAQRDAIDDPAEGLMIFNTSSKCLEMFVNEEWTIGFCPGCTAPATPGTISGPNSVCSGSSGHVFSIAPVSGANTYNWSVPPGAMVTDGLGTTSITVTAGTLSGNVSVTASGNCGTSAASSLTVTVNEGSSGSQTFNYSGSVASFTVPACAASITIQAYGAQGGNGVGSNPAPGGKGAYMIGTVSANTGDVWNIMVGQQGGSSAGGGGSFVWNTSDANTLLMAAAGGGGGGGSNNGGVLAYAGDGQITTTPSSGGGTGTAAGGTGGSGGSGGANWAGWSGSGGGAGWSGNGADGTPSSEPRGGGGFSPLDPGSPGVGGYAGFSGGTGGFGGGGGSTYPGGGGGGYNGGGGGNAWNLNGAPDHSGGGGGGGSYYINGSPESGSAAGYQSGNGQVILTW